MNKRRTAAAVPKALSVRARKSLLSHDWPGNVRELANVLQQMMVLCGGNTISTRDLPPHLFLREETVPEVEGGAVPLMGMVEDLEKRWILSKLKETGWNKERAGELLGITRKMLNNRVKKYNLKPPKNRPSKA